VGGTLQFGLDQIPDSLNPILAKLEDTWIVLDSIYSRLVTMNPATGESLPSLARSWVIEPDGDELRITFNLLNNATWHDGEFFNAYDVNFTYHYLNNLPGPWPYANPKPHIEFSSIQVLNNITLVILTPLTDYFALFDITSAVILPEHIWGGIIRPAFFENPRPVGTGPFMFDKQPEPGLIYLSYYPDYPYAIVGARELPPVLDISFLLWLTGGIFVIVLTVVGAIWYLRRRPHGLES
jgi:peptide/nickel transport system substrate-binding protein